MPISVFPDPVVLVVVRLRQPVNQLIGSSFGRVVIFRSEILKSDDINSKMKK